MPSFNLRLTDEQHAQVERWAAVNNRSMQKEIVHRLFARPGSGMTDVLPEVDDADAHFKPDPKPTPREKKGRR